MSYTPIPSGGGGGGGGGAPTTATYVVLAGDAGLSGERVLTAGSGISITDAGAGGALTIAATGGAPTAAQYVTLAADGTLTNERVLTAGTGITLTDAGAGSTLTIAASGGAPTTAQYVTLATDATLANERVLTAGTGITLTDAGAGSTLTIAAPATAAQYVTLAASGDLANERVLTAGTNITLTDNGAGGTLVIAASGGGAVAITNTVIPIGNGTTIVDSTLTLASNVFTHAAGASGAIVGWAISNTSNTANAHAKETLTVAGTSAGSPSTTYTVTGGQSVTCGISNTLSDHYVIANGTSQATGSTAPFVLDTVNSVLQLGNTDVAFISGASGTFRLQLYGIAGTVAGTLGWQSADGGIAAHKSVIDIGGNDGSTTGAHIVQYAAGNTWAGNVKTVPATVFGVTQQRTAGLIWKNVDGFIGTPSAKSIFFGTSDLKRLTIDSGGSVTIGNGAAATDLVVGTTAGVKVATATTQKLGFWNATPVVQQTGGAATAGGTYTATEQTMLQTLWDNARTLGLMS